MKDGLLQAIKRKRYLKQYQSQDDSPGGHEQEGDLAPSSSASHSHDALLGGNPVQTGMGKDTRDAGNQNQTAFGKQGGLEKHGKVSSPANSKNLFQDVKHDPHDPVDLNRDRNMAGDGSNSKYDKMGVDEHTPLQQQGSKLTSSNLNKTKSLKDRARKDVKGKMNIDDNNPSHGEDVSENIPVNEMQKGFAAPRSPSNRAGDPKSKWDQDAQGTTGLGLDGEGLYDKDNDEGLDEHIPEPNSRFSGIKGAHARLEGFLKRKQSKQ